MYKNSSDSKTLHHIEVDIKDILNRSCEVPGYRNATDHGRDTWKTYVSNYELKWIWDIIKDENNASYPYIWNTTKCNTTLGTDHAASTAF